MHFKHIFRLTNISDSKISDILRREQNFQDMFWHCKEISNMIGRSLKKLCPSHDNWTLIRVYIRVLNHLAAILHVYAGALNFMK